MVLRQANLSDMVIISQLAEQIWPQTYSTYISETQLRYMLNLMYNQTELQNQVQNGHTFLIAQLNGVDVGFAGFSILNETTHTYKLHKLYVLPQIHGKGLGKILVNEVVNLAIHKGGKTLQLNVNRNNNAKDFYLKIGFNIKETVDLDIGNGFFMNDYVMEKKLY